MNVTASLNLKLEPSLAVPILMYHRIGRPVTGTFGSLTVAPEAFSRQIKWLAAKGYRGISLSEMLSSAASQIFPPRAVVLTFDDAYESLVECAIPVLEEYRFTATIFAVSDQLGGTNRWDRERGSAELPLMSDLHLRELLRSGFEIGSHSRSHRRLQELRQDELTEEVVGSRTILENAIGAPVTSFAYPYGEFDDRALDLVKANYRCACTTIEGLNFGDTPVHQLRRTMISPGTRQSDFMRRVTNGKNSLEDARRATKNKIASIWSRLRG